MQWSDAQLKAIETKHKNLLVEAAAGSGKTGRDGTCFSARPG